MGRWLHGRGWGAITGLASVAGLGVVATGASSEAGDWNRVVLVELFTSQGCSSCPPADRLVAELPALGLGRDRVVPLTFHVTYWDELGWKDRFAAPAFTERQRWYVKAASLRPPDGQQALSGLYTPQMIVDGQVHFSGARREVALAALREAARRPPAVDVSATAEASGQQLSVRVDVLPRPGLRRDQDWRLVVALAARETRTQVSHGENAGETLREAAVVRALVKQALPALPARAVAVTLQKPADVAWSQVELVAFLQSEVTREIAGAIAFRPDAP